VRNILSGKQLALTVQRLAQHILEDQLTSSEIVLIGIQPRGVLFSDRLYQAIQAIEPSKQVNYGKLDITFYRDDIRKELHVANATDVNFSIENKQVVLVDDVLYTGRTIRSAFDALLAFGRPAGVKLCVLIDRRFSREFPIQPDYVGKSIDSLFSQKVKVFWEENSLEGRVEFL
jgi:pyrimidine operon attenuation protein/uracil phosphoribosyltransferase